LNAAAEKFGQRMRRREDPALLTGKGLYLAGLIKPGMAAMRVIRSPLAHARIKRIDFSPLETDPECLGFLSAADLPEALGTLPAMDLLGNSAAVQQRVLAQDCVRYAGEPVAVVFAENEYLAEDLAERVIIEYEALPAVMNVQAGIATDAPLLYPGHGSNVVHQTTQHVGDPDGAFAAASVIIEEAFTFRRQMGSPMETRGAMATLEPGSGRYVLHSSTQIPQVLRTELARITGVSLERLRVVSPRIGGGFGCKEAVFPEEVLLLLALQKFQRPVYWIEDRAESFSATVHGREQTMRVRAALDADGIVTAIEADCLADIGAAYSLFSNTPSAAVATVRGPYRIPNFRSRARSVVTNKTPLNVYRGAGYPQATLAMERMMDLAAARLGVDRAEIRRRNLLQPDAFPVDRGVSYPGCGLMIYDSGNFPAVLDSTLEAIGYGDFDARREKSQCEQSEVSLGLGLSFVVEMTSGGGVEPARLKLASSGRLQLLSGITAIGQGSETTMAQILSDHLGCPADMIEVLAGDTDDSPNAPGTFASRGATMGGNAACNAGDAFIREARRLAAQVRGVHVDDITWKHGALHLRGVSSPLTLKSLISEAQARDLDAAQRLDVTARFDDTGIGYASACHAAIVAVDRGTGVIRVLDYAVTHDCGRVANPLLVDGQIMGGVVQGLGGCLFEALEYSESGLLMSQTYMDYVLPTAATAPRFILRHIETPSPLNPLGMKGAGEAGCSGAAAAIVNAIADALGPQVRLPGGSGPFTPAVVRELLRNASPKELSTC
jgi:aerobic carbon-monoxide dehydrogenase large subunit